MSTKKFHSTTDIKSKSNYLPRLRQNRHKVLKPLPGQEPEKYIAKAPADTQQFWRNASNSTLQHPAGRLLNLKIYERRESDYGWHVCQWTITAVCSGHAHNRRIIIDAGSFDMRWKETGCDDLTKIKNFSPPLEKNDRLSITARPQCWPLSNLKERDWALQ